MSAVRKPDRRVERARSFRRDPTDAERKLWQRLRQISDAHFRRQATIGSFFADFACHTTRLVIEVDGGQHAENCFDARRTAFLASQGYRVLRFWNHDVLNNIEGVTEVIANAVAFTPPTPDPSPPREERVGGWEKAKQLLPSTRSCGGEGSGVGGIWNTDSDVETSSGGYS